MGGTWTGAASAFAGSATTTVLAGPKAEVRLGCSIATMTQQNEIGATN